MIRNAIQRFMYGRYGVDQLNLFLAFAFIALSLLNAFFHSAVLYWIAWIPLLLELFRTFSRDLSRRREENVKFMKMVGPALSWLRLRRTIHRDKEHVYFKCPNCSQQLRVPRGKGKINVTCRSCGASFQEKS